MPSPSWIRIGIVLLVVLLGSWQVGAPRDTSRQTDPGSAQLTFTVSGSLTDSVIQLRQWLVADGGNDHWYGILAVLHDWIEADSIARTLTLDTMLGYLATIQGASENYFIFDSVLPGADPPSTEEQFLLGGERVAGAWQWSTGEPLCYLNWASGEPNSPLTETVIAMWGPDRVPQPNPPGSWNNTRPDNLNSPNFRFWAVVEWGDLNLSPVVVCGDGTEECGEECDDGNLNNNDGCNSACQIELCGDANANGSVTSADFVQLLNFLYADSSITADYKYADTDDYDLITLRDVLYLWDHLAFGGAAPICPPANGRIVPAPSTDIRIEHTSLIPGNASAVAVLFRLVIMDSGVARAINLAVTLSVEGVASSIDSVDSQMDWSRGWVNVEPAGAPLGTLTAGFLEPYGAQSGESDLLTVYATIAPSPNPRLLTVEYVPLPPFMDDEFGVLTPVNNTMILDNWYDAWVPDTSVCAIWNTGDVNLDLALTTSDVIAIVNYVFKGGMSPYPCPASADVNCSGDNNSADIIRLVNHVFKSGPAPCDVCTLIPGMWSCTP